MKLLIVLGILVAGFFVADTVAENTAEKRAEERIERSIPQGRGISVDVQGGLFLPQLLGGGFETMLVTADEVRRGGLPVEDLSITFRDVSFSPSDLMAGEGALRVSGGRGTAAISERALNAALADEGVEAEVVLDGEAALSAGGRSAALDRLTLDDEGRRVVFSAPPLEPLSLALPSAFASVNYSDVRVEGDHLVVELTVARGKVEL